MRTSKPTRKKQGALIEKPVGDDGVTVFIAQSEQYVCLADGRKIPFDEYHEQSRDVIRGIAPAALTDLLALWIDKSARKNLRAEFKDRDVHVAACRHFFDLDATDDVDILAKVDFDLAWAPARHDRVAWFWDREAQWLVSRVGEQAADDTDRVKRGSGRRALTGVDPVWWTPRHCAKAVFRWQGHPQRTRRSTGAGWWSRFARAARPEGWIASSSAALRRSAIGCVKRAATRAVVRTV